MTPADWASLETVAIVLWAPLAVLAAFFWLLDVVYEDRSGRVREHFASCWRAIDESRWLTIPEVLARRLHEAWPNASKNIVHLLRHHYYFLWGLRWVQPFLLGAAALLLWNWWIALLVAVASVVLSLWHYTLEKAPFLIRGRLGSLVVLLVITVEILAIPVIATLLIPRLTFLQRALVLLVAAPYYGIGVAIILAQLVLTPMRIFLQNMKPWSERTEYNVISFGAVVAMASFVITYLALALGLAARPDDYIPGSVQVLIANMVFDILTVITTFSLLRWATSKQSVVRIPVAIVLDLLIAALLACGSLFFALIGTKYAIDLAGTIRVLIGKLPESPGVGLGSHFWLMHTAFLPTAIFLGLLGIAWLAKVLMTMLRAYFGESKQHPHPYRLAWALFGFLAAIFFSIYLLAGHFKKLERSRDANDRKVPSNYIGDSPAELNFRPGQISGAARPRISFRG